MIRFFSSFLFLIITILFCLIPSLKAQSATMRMDLPGPDGFRAIRPGEFIIERAAVVPFTAELNALTDLGEFLTRFGQSPRALPAKLDIDAKYHPRAATRAYAASDTRTLRLEVECEEPFPEQMGKEISSLYYVDDRVEILLDLDHDHHDFFLIAVWPSGKSRVKKYMVRENHLAWDRRFVELEGEIEVSLQAETGPPGWRFQADINLAANSAEPGGWRVVGLNMVRHRGVGGEETTMWCPDHKRVSAPLYFGDLYLGRPPMVVSRVELGSVCWGENHGALQSDSVGAVSPVEVTTYNYRGVYRQATFRFGKGACEFKYHLDPHELMNSALELSIGPVSWGRYEFGWKRSILLTHRPTGEFKARKPEPGESDYYWKYCRYILDRLPALERASDGLSLAGEGILIDLRSNDALEKLAGVVTRRFSTDEDRIAGATFLLCQQGVMVSSSTGAGISQLGDGVAALRVGAAFCDTYGELLRDLILQIENSKGEPFKACVVNFVPGKVNTFGWPHHWLTGVAYREGITLIDAELGTVFVEPEKGRLATLEELLERPELADLASYGLSEYYRNKTLEDFKVREAGDFWEFR